MPRTMRLSGRRSRNTAASTGELVRAGATGCQTASDGGITLYEPESEVRPWS